MTEENRALGTPLGKHPTRVLFLGSGELGKEVTIELMRLGAWVCAADSYAGAPAQQVAHEYRVLDMANADQLRALFDEIQPDIIVPEVEAIATSELAAAAARGAQVVPSAEIAAICMDRERLRVLAHEELGLPTTPYRFAGSLEELREGAQIVGYPCVVKPIMSSSGHGQSVVRSADAIDAAWTEAQEGRRAHDEGDVSRVIVEALAPLDYELTVLTVSSSAGIVTCAPIGQRQESGDYRESWQPATFTPDVLEQAQHIARTAVEGLVAKAQASGEKGWGVFGVELFVLTDGNVLFNEVSPRPHDTGMVTMASQRLSEFALHARAILGLPIAQEHVALSIPEGTVAASHAIVVQGDGEAEFRNVAAALAEPGTDLRVFAKPEVHGHRRMAVALAVGAAGYALGRKKYPDRVIEVETAPKSGNAEVDALIREARGQLDQIAAANDAIADPALSRQIEDIEATCRLILQRLEEQPNMLSQLRTFLRYYLPATLKLLNARAALEAEVSAGQSADIAARIAKAVEQVQSAFHKQLDALNEFRFINLESEMDVLADMLKSDGLTAEPDAPAAKEAEAPQEDDPFASLFAKGEKK